VNHREPSPVGYGEKSCSGARRLPVHILSRSPNAAWQIICNTTSTPAYLSVWNKTISWEMYQQQFKITVGLCVLSKWTKKIIQCVSKNVPLCDCPDFSHILIEIGQFSKFVHWWYTLWTICGLHARHLQPLDAFSAFLMRPKCICAWSSISNPTGKLTALPTCSWWGESSETLSKKSSSKFRPFGLQESSPR